MSGRGYALNLYADGLSRSHYKTGKAHFTVVVKADTDPRELKKTIEVSTGTEGAVALIDERDDSIISLSIVCQAPDIMTARRYKVLFEQPRAKVPSPSKMRSSSPVGSRVRLDSSFEDEEDDEEVEDFWLFQAHLLMAITFFEDSSELDEEAAETLRRLVSDGDERLMAAMQLFSEDEDWDELRDTLQRVAELELSEQLDAESDDDETDDYDDLDYDEEDEEEFDDDEFDELDKTLSLQVVAALCKRNLLSKNEALVVKRLVDLNNPLIQAAMEVFEQQGDEDDFADTLSRVAEFHGLDRIVLAMLQHEYISREEAAILLRLFRDPNSHVTKVWKAYAIHRNQRVLADQLLTVLICMNKKRFLLQMNAREVFDAPETSILLDLLKKQDPALMAIFEVLVDDGDLSDTIDSLKRLCLVRSGLKQDDVTETIARMPSTLGEEGTQALDIVRALAVNGTLSEVQYLILTSLIGKQDERVMAAYEAYAVDNDMDDFVDTLKHVALLGASDSLGSSDTNMPGGGTTDGMNSDKAILDTMFHLVYTGKLAPEEASVLGELVTTRDPRLLASFDVYQIEGDLEDLTDTLQRIALKELMGKSAEEFEAYIIDDDEDEDDEDDIDEDYDDFNELDEEDDDDDDSLSGETITDDDEYAWLSDESPAGHQHQLSGTNISITSTPTIDQDQAKSSVSSCSSPCSGGSVEQVDMKRQVCNDPEVAKLIDIAREQCGEAYKTVLDGAIKLYGIDGDLDELRDTISRIARHSGQNVTTTIP
mmetsp:Transcript_6150/g.10526  ORF Transcript_6150/g.10526 Transcript_6150/m.10526 type:complete len:766 (+) Transcript_6150:3304-5601(+)